MNGPLERSASGPRAEEFTTTIAMPPPRNDPEAERAVLGGILLDNAALGLVEGLLDSSDFYSPAHGLVWECIVALGARSQPIDIITLVAELRSRDRLNAVGGPQYLGDLTDTIPTIAHIESHARIVADCARVRRLVEEAVWILSGAARGLGADELCARAEERVMKATLSRDTKEMVHLGDAVLESIDHYEAVALGSKKLTGTPTGYDALDELTDGLHGGQSIIIAARPAMGKSALSTNIARHAAARGGKPVLIFSLEMPLSEITRRFLAERGEIDQTLLRKVKLCAADTGKMFSAANALSGLPIWIDDTADISIGEIRAKARRIRQKHGPLGLIVIDYLTLVRPGRESGSREQDVAKISRGMKMMAKELDVPVVSLAQLNRECETRADKRPILADLRESGSLEQDADVVMFLYRDVVYNKKCQDPYAAEVIVAKQRNGPCDTVTLRFIRPHARFIEPAADEFAQMTNEAADDGEDAPQEEIAASHVRGKYGKGIGPGKEDDGDG